MRVGFARVFFFLKRKQQCERGADEKHMLPYLFKWTSLLFSCALMSSDTISETTLNMRSAGVPDLSTATTQENAGQGKGKGDGRC